MDSHYLQQQRFQLQKRVRRLNSCDHTLFHSALVQFWNYLQEHVLYRAVIDKLVTDAPIYSEEIEKLKHRDITLFTSERDALNFSFRIIEYCAVQPVDVNGHIHSPEVQLGHGLNQGPKHAEALDAFRDAFLDPFFEYLDESLDQTGAILSLLIKYRQRVEWFYRTDVLAMASTGERKLAPHLYAYLHDQGLEFSIEPEGPSGIPDLVSRDLVMDVKLFDGSTRSVSYIASGVHQVHTYLREFEQVTGYLVIYRICPEALHFAFSTPDRLLPSLHIGGKIIYLLVIDICDHAASASKRGTLREFNVEEATLVRQLQGTAEVSVPPDEGGEQTTPSSA